MSIMRQMKDKAIAMAEAMAERARSPQDIEAARQRLVAEIQGGRVPAYVGVPLVQDLTQRLTQAKAQMAQQVAGMGVPQAPQGAPIAQQVMAQAQPAAGVEALPSNLPTSYAPGGLVAFEEGGQVERYQNTGLVGGVASQAPVSVEDLVKLYRTDPALAEQAASRARMLPALRQAIGAVGVPGVVANTGLVLSAGSAGYLRSLSPEQREQLTADIGSDTGFAAAILNAAKPPAGNTPTAAAADLGPVPGTQGSNQILGGRLRYADMPDYQSTGAQPGAQPGVAMPKLNLPTFTPTAAPELTDLSAIVNKLPKESKTAFEDARKAEEDYLRGITQPGEEAREKRFSAREAALEKDSAMGRALNIINLGLRVAGSKEKTVAGAWGNEGAASIQALIQGEAANRVAKERLEDARDNFEQQKMAAKKGDRAAAIAAGQRAAEDVRAYGQLNLQAAQAGNTQAQQRWHTENSLGFQGAQLQQQGILGLAQIQQQNAATNASLQLGREKLGILKEQVAAGNKRAEAALAGAQQKAYAAFQSSPAYRQAQEQAKKMDPIQAQRFMQQEWLKYSANAIPSLLGGSDMGIPSFSDLYKATE